MSSSVCSCSWARPYSSQQGVWVVMQNMVPDCQLGGAGVVGLPKETCFAAPNSHTVNKLLGKPHSSIPLTVLMTVPLAAAAPKCTATHIPPGPCAGSAGPHQIREPAGPCRSGHAAPTAAGHCGTQRRLCPPAVRSSIGTHHGTPAKSSALSVPCCERTEASCQIAKPSEPDRGRHLVIAYLHLAAS